MVQGAAPPPEHRCRRHTHRESPVNIWNDSNAIFMGQRIH
jgi:hypothetical protein